MIIRSLELENYRNYESLHLNFDDHINVFYGDNAQGKTNALEAMFLCATTKSHRGSKDREMIRFGAEESHIKLIVEKQGVPCRIDMHLKKNRSKGVAVNGIPIHKVTELFGILNVIFFSPEDLGIIKNSPAERRRFIDLELCQLDKVYTHNLINYNKVVSQRNKLLKEIDYRKDLLDTLEIWDMQMVRYARPVIERRQEFVKELGRIMAEIHGSITGSREKIRLEYAPHVDASVIERKLAGERARDLKAKVSLTGPHRDDLLFFINDIDVRQFGSQGQQRTAALSLKLAEIELVKKKIREKPVLLLDDVLSELDSGRQERLLESVGDIQTMITCTGLDDFVAHCFHIDKSFHIESGRQID